MKSYATIFFGLVFVFNLIPLNIRAVSYMPTGPIGTKYNPVYIQTNSNSPYMPIGELGTKYNPIYIQTQNNNYLTPVSSVCKYANNLNGYTSARDRTIAKLDEVIKSSTKPIDSSLYIYRGALSRRYVDYISFCGTADKAFNLYDPAEIRQQSQLQASVPVGEDLAKVESLKQQLSQLIIQLEALKKKR